MWMEYEAPGIVDEFRPITARPRRIDRVGCLAITHGIGKGLTKKAYAQDLPLPEHDCLWLGLPEQQRDQG